MKAKKILQKISITASVCMLLALSFVSAYNFTVNNQVLLQGTTFHIDGSQFRDNSGTIQVYLSHTWYDICSGSYTLDGEYITILQDVECEITGESPLCHGGGGCGG